MKYGDGIFLTDGPPLDGLQAGFFYEMHLRDGKTVSQDNFNELLKIMKVIIKSKQAFVRREVSKGDAKIMFEKNVFKLHMLDRIPDNEKITLYRNGDFIDLCRGPHVSNTSKLQSIDLLACGASHWTGGAPASENGSDNNKGTLLQRVYGISFPEKKEMDTWMHLREEAKKRDHRIIGREQGMLEVVNSFFFFEY